MTDGNGELRPGERIEIEDNLCTPEMVHVFDERDVNAIKAALAAKRPLLLRGDPGTGKSQTAVAATVALKRAFLSFVVSARTEAQDLLWHFDAVARLACAQLAHALGGAAVDRERIEAELADRNFVHPGCLWWAFDWKDARKQAALIGQKEPKLLPGTSPENGTVVLVDEIDKAETDVPNGLLEALGASSFRPQGRDEPVEVTGSPPLVIITTNEERALPDAFVRRCLVHNLRLPDDDPKQFKELLVARAKAHFGKEPQHVYDKAADMLLRDRATAKSQQVRPIPGQAEYLDLVRAVLKLAGDDITAQNYWLGEVGRFTLVKHVSAS
jgi:MoxR-like ATPase